MPYTFTLHIHFRWDKMHKCTHSFKWLKVSDIKCASKMWWSDDVSKKWQKMKILENRIAAGRLYMCTKQLYEFFFKFIFIYLFIYFKSVSDGKWWTSVWSLFTPTALSERCLRYRCYDLPAEPSPLVLSHLLTNATHSVMDGCL